MWPRPRPGPPLLAFLPAVHEGIIDTEIRRLGQVTQMLAKLAALSGLLAGTGLARFEGQVSQPPGRAPQLRQGPFSTAASIFKNRRGAQLPRC